MVKLEKVARWLCVSCYKEFKSLYPWSCLWKKFLLELRPPPYIVIPLATEFPAPLVACYGGGGKVSSTTAVHYHGSEIFDVHPNLSRGYRSGTNAPMSRSIIARWQTGKPYWFDMYFHANAQYRYPDPYIIQYFSMPRHFAPLVSNLSLLFERTWTAVRSSSYHGW